jgi:hypothetical protein
MYRNGTLDVIGHKRKEPVPCSADGCNSDAICKGMCARHYAKSRYNYVPHPPNTVPVEDRFWMLVDRRASNECWHWLGTKMAKGYGDFRTRKDGLSSTLAHRISYQFLIGPIPEGSHLHHTCGNKSCVNPAHLEPTRPDDHYILTWVRKLRSLGYTVTEPEHV